MTPLEPSGDVGASTDGSPGMTCGSVAVVDDDATVNDVVSRYLTTAGYAVRVLVDGTEALQALCQGLPDLIILDLMLPGIGCLELFRRLRVVSAVPVIMLAALGEEGDRLAGLELGADDYVTKPFSPRELVLRVRAVLRRGSPPSARLDHLRRRCSDRELRVDVAAHHAWLGGGPLSLTAREDDLSSSCWSTAVRRSAESSCCDGSGMGVRR